jgi:hypothetical protein
MSITSKKILLVTALADSFRRAGFGFTDKGTALLPEQLTDDQYQQIIGEKRLSVREVTPDQIPDGVDTSAIQSLLAGNGQGATTDGTQSTVTVNTLAEAFALLDPSNPDHFTQGNKPQLDPLSKMLGRPVSGGERDSAWDAYKAAGSV